MLNQCCKEKILGGKLHEAYERVLKSYVPDSSYDFLLILTISIDRDFVSVLYPHLPF